MSAICTEPVCNSRGASSSEYLWTQVRASFEDAESAFSPSHLLRCHLRLYTQQIVRPNEIGQLIPAIEYSCVRTICSIASFIISGFIMATVAGLHAQLIRLHFLPGPSEIDP